MIKMIKPKLTYNDGRYFEENIETDLEFALRTEEAWKSYEQGEFKSVLIDKFVKKLGKFSKQRTK